MASKSSPIRNSESESELVEYMRGQFGRNLSPAEALELHERSLKIPKC
jgi:hypothetical protein